MQQRIYVGGHDEVEVPSLGVIVKRGESVEVDADMAELMDAQPTNWAKPNTKAAKEVDQS